MRIIFLFLTASLILLSCNTKKENKGKNDFSFYLQEADLYITTSKRVGGLFYVMFSKTYGVSELSDSVDYIQCDVEDASLEILFDPDNKNEFFLKYPFIRKINQKKLSLIELYPDEFNRIFYHPGVTTTPDTLKNPYKVVFIAPMSYNIIFQRDSTFNSQVVLKEGDMWGR
ncbi:hypothetical protein [Sphingobacterium endophyticum]|uniref:hypothetical protein n=1 Tax=Sphingobacterium endophyticum TaxID=2546448 RepID=UPI0012E1247A|nr:hypothetical protein [Sphingobacterium endophyticum]